MRTHTMLIAAALALAAGGCRRPLATRPDQLVPGTFAIGVHGRMGAPDTTATFDDRITGTACRVGTFVLLDSRDLSRRTTVWVPAFADTPVTYPLRARPPRFRHDSSAVRAFAGDSLRAEGAAEGHLNYGPSTRGSRPTGRGSMQMVDGAVTVAVHDPGDLQGSLHAHLREGIFGERVSPATADLAGVFRVDARDVCEYGRPARSGLVW